MSKKAKNETIRARVEETLQIRLRGATFSDIVKHAEENGWGVGERQLRYYISKSDDILEATLEKDRQKLINRHIAQRQVLYAHAFAAADYATARNVLRDEAELLNLYPARRTEITGKEGNPIEVVVMNDDEIRECLRTIVQMETLATSSTDEADSEEADSNRSNLF